MLTSRAMKWLVAGVFLAAPLFAAAQTPDAPQPVATMKRLMLDVIHPASNALLLLIHRGGPGDDKEWTEARRSAIILAESGNLLIIRNRAAAWSADAKLLTDAGAAAYKAAEAKDVKALTASADRIDASCTTCHKHSRPNVFPESRR
jgi:opacity protein-like surface antigen